MASYRAYTPTFQDALDEFSHLDLTTNVVKEASEQLGGGGFSDVFRSKMRLGWQARHDPHIEQLLSEIRVQAGNMTPTNPESDPDGPMVAVKRLRLWGRPILKVEKV